MESRKHARRGAGLALAFVVGAVALACAAPRSAMQAPSDPELRPIEQEVIRLTNTYRRTRALPAVREDPFLAALARRHSGDMARAGGHIDHQGLRRRFERAAARLPLTKFAENVARTRLVRTPPASWVVTGWIESPDHREHLEGEFGLVGVGVVRSASGDLYFTQILAAVRSGG